MDPLDIILPDAERRQLQALGDVLALNELSAQFGLVLGETEALALVARGESALRGAGRVSFGEGPLRALIFAFCDSPYLEQKNYEQTLAELLDAFYYFKSESGESLADDELISMMRTFYDAYEGSLDHLFGTSLEELARHARENRDGGAAPAL